MHIDGFESISVLVAWVNITAVSSSHVLSTLHIRHEHHSILQCISYGPVTTVAVEENRTTILEKI